MTKLIITTIAMFVYTLVCGADMLIADMERNYTVLFAIIGGYWLPAFALWYSVNKPEPEYIPRKEVSHERRAIYGNPC